MNDIILDLVTELCEFSIEELKEFKGQWKQELENKGLGQKIINALLGIVDFVIAEKINK